MNMIYEAKERVLEPFDVDQFLKIGDENYDNLIKIDEEAKKSGNLLYRVLFEPYADGNAAYQVIKVNKKTVKVRVCKGFGDEWVIPSFGEECLLQKDYVENVILGRDKFLEMINQRKSAKA